MSIIRLATLDDLPLIEQILRANPKVSSDNISPFSDEEISKNIKDHADKISKNEQAVALLLNDDNSPVAFYLGYYMKASGGWIIHGPRMTTVQTSYYQTAKICAPLLDFLIDHMESKMYFKFWQVDVGGRHLLRRNIMTKYSEKLARYDYYDEIKIPAGKPTGIIMYDSFSRNFVFNSDRIVRMHVLRQEYRDQLITNYYTKESK